MKSFIRGVASACVGLGLLGVVGCGPDNEADAQKAASEKKDLGQANPNAIQSEAKPLPKTQEEFFKNTPDPRAQSGKPAPAPAPAPTTPPKS